MLRVVSWNVHGLPWPLAKNTARRVGAMADALRDAAPDIVLLQEVWSQEAGADFARRLSQLGFEVAAPRRAGWGRATGGLMTLHRRSSVARVAEAVFTPYRSRASSWRIWEGDGTSNKGILATRFQTLLGPLTILNTHMQSQYGLRPGAWPRQPHRQVRTRQFEELRRLSESYEAPLIAAGDFNTFPEELKDMPLAGWVEVTADFRRSCRCGTYLENDSSWWLDYAFAAEATLTKWRVQASLITNQSPDVPFSDHHALIIDASTKATVAAYSRELTKTSLTRREILMQLLSRFPQLISIT